MDNRERHGTWAGLEEGKAWADQEEYVYVPDDANVQKNALYVSEIPASMQSLEQIRKLFENYGLDNALFHKSHLGDWSKVKLTFREEGSALKAYKDFNAEVPLEDSFRVEWWRNFGGTENVQTENSDDAKCDATYVRPPNQYLQPLVSTVKNCLSSRPPTSRRFLARDFYGLSGHLPDIPVGQEVRTRDIHMRIIQGRMYGPPQTADDSPDDFAPQFLIGSERNRMNPESEGDYPKSVLPGERNVCHVCETVTSNEPCYFCEEPVYCRAECAYKHLNEHMRRCKFANSSPNDSEAKSSDSSQSEEEDDDEFSNFANSDADSDGGRDDEKVRNGGWNDWQLAAGRSRSEGRVKNCASGDTNEPGPIGRSNKLVSNDTAGRDSDRKGRCEGSESVSGADGGFGNTNQREDYYARGNELDEETTNAMDETSKGKAKKAGVGILPSRMHLVRLNVPLSFYIGARTDDYANTTYWIILKSDNRALGQLTDELADYPLNSVDQLTVASLVVVPYKHEGWFRCQVRSIDDENVHVFFIDYGDEVKVQRGHVRALPQQLRDVLPFAMKVKLPKNSPPKFRNMESGDEITLIIKSKNEDWLEAEIAQEDD